MSYLQFPSQSSLSRSSFFAFQKGRNGFENFTDSTMSFVDATRTFTIAPVSTHFKIAQEGTQYIITSSNSVVISNDVGPHYVYFDGNTLKETTTFTSDLILKYSLCTIIYWTGAAKILMAEERHGWTMDAIVHYHMHASPGTIYISGFTLGYTIPAGNPADDSASRVYLSSSGVIADEDIPIQPVHDITPSGRFQQDLGSGLESDSAAVLPIFSLTGSGTWVREIDATNRFAFSHNAGNTPPYYNQLSGTWGKTAVSANYHVNYYLCAWNDWNYPLFLKMGQSQHSNLTNASAENPGDLSWGDYNPAEIIILYKLTFEYKAAYTNATHRTKLVQVTDYRSQAFSRATTGGSLVNHNSLTGLSYDAAGHTGFQRATVTSTSDPTVNEDIGDGYTNGTLWLNTATPALFILKDNTLGAAVWVAVTLSP